MRREAKRVSITEIILKTYFGVGNNQECNGAPPTKGQGTLCGKPESLSRGRFQSKARAMSKKAASGEREAHFRRT